MVTQAYIDKDTANTRKPVELYRFWLDSGNQTWRFADGDVAVTYAGCDYEPAYLKRDSLRFETDLNITKQNISVARLNQAFINYLTQPMPEMVWVEISKLFRDQDPIEKRVLFIGQVARCGYNGVDGQIECTGFEKFLKMRVPTLRYQPSCNHKLFSEACGTAITTYALTMTIDTISANGLTITAAAFSAKENDYYKLGYIEWGDFKRTIVTHESNTITIQFYIPGLAASEDIYVAPGCAKSMDACRDKYNNLNNPALDRFFGFRYLPRDNPAMWQN